MVEFVTGVAAQRSGILAVVLNVQDLRGNARLRGYESFKQQEIESRLINELGGPIVNNVSTRLQKAGVLSVPAVQVGDPVSIIMDYAAENACDAIVIGEPRPKGIRSWIAAVTRLPIVSPPPPAHDPNCDATRRSEISGSNNGAGAGCGTSA